MTTATKTILVIEDNTALALGLRNNLEYEGYAAVVAHDAAGGLAAAREHDPDLIIIDLMLPDADGFRVLRELRAAGSSTPVLVLTALGDEADKVRGLRVGADDYVTKPSGLMELLARVDALLRRAARPAAPARPNGGGGAAAHDVTAFGEVTVCAATHAVTRGGAAVALRPKEYELLVALLRRDGAVASRHELLREVWGYDESVTSRTVDTHMAELRRKLEHDPANPRHLLTVRKTGYRLDVAGGSA
jgi:DNA-binding response OmpR family regulator